MSRPEHPGDVPLPPAWQDIDDAAAAEDRAYQAWKDSKESTQ